MEDRAPCKRGEVQMCFTLTSPPGFGASQWREELAGRTHGSVRAQLPQHTQVHRACGSCTAHLPWQKYQSEKGTGAARCRLSRARNGCEFRWSGQQEWQNREESKARGGPPAHPVLWVHHTGSGITSNFDALQRAA